MKNVPERPKSLLVTVMMVGFAMIVGFGDLANLIPALPELPYKIVTNLKILPERMDPTCSECR